MADNVTADTKWPLKFPFIETGMNLPKFSNQSDLRWVQSHFASGPMTHQSKILYSLIFILLLCSC